MDMTTTTSGSNIQSPVTVAPRVRPAAIRPDRVDPAAATRRRTGGRPRPLGARRSVPADSLGVSPRALGVLVARGDVGQPPGDLGLRVGAPVGSDVRHLRAR